MYWIHKHEVALESGGPEEGGWWFTSGIPDDTWTPFAIEDETEAYDVCYDLNQQEKERQRQEEDYEFSSVLAYRSTHYQYSIQESSVMKPFPEQRPHYE